MNCLDSSYLIDYLNGHPDAQAYVESHPSGSFYAPTLVLFELYDGVDEYIDRDIDEIETAIDWVMPMDLTAGCVREAIKIKGELKAEGTPVNLKDMLIAGTVREAGGTLVTRDNHFDRVEGLRVATY